VLELNVDNQVISYVKINEQDYISITDMLKSKDGDFFVSDWLRNRNTVEFLGIWEEIHNPNFNYGELNNYKLSVKEWIKKQMQLELFLRQEDMVGLMHTKI